MAQEMTQLRNGKMRKFVIRANESNRKTEQIFLQNLSLSLYFVNLGL
jgi:hypothetical protein